MAKTSKKLTKSLGPIGKLISIIPDTTELIGKAIDNSRPIIEKELDRRHEKKQTYTQLDNVVHLDINDAQVYLEQRHFNVSRIVAEPNSKWTTLHPNQVVNMSPKAGRVRIGSLVKLYYITEDILEESKTLLLSKSEKSKARQQRLTEVLSTPSQLLKKNRNK
ncbi:TPA: PASTA domain-containing protein [Streptococcus agalactiae]